jgi:hypothetical protein
VAAALAATACAPKLTITRRPATATERTAVVECAAAIATDGGLAVTERRPDLGRLTAATPSADDDAAPEQRGGGDDLASALARGAGEPAVDELTVSIARHPLNDGLALLVRATARSGAAPAALSQRAAMTRDRILRGCSYLVG